MFKAATLRLPEMKTQLEKLKSYKSNKGRETTKETVGITSIDYIFRVEFPIQNERYPLNL